MSSVMKAVRFDRFGGPEVLHLAEVDVPEPGPGQVRVRVRTAGVNPFDGKVRAGLMEPVFHTPLPATPGLEVAGTIDAAGEGAEAGIGDEVLGWADTGSYAEYALATTVTGRPEGLSWEAAVAVPVAGSTALRVLRLLELTGGETLLIHGAAGAVGTFAVQLAVARGATVIGTAGPDNHGHVAALGAMPTEYGEGLVDRVRELAPQGVDAVFDIAGKGALPESVELRGSTDRIITIADPAAQSLGVSFSSGGPEDRSVADLAGLVAQVGRGELAVTVAGTYPLSEAANAQRASDAGHARGKFVITVG
ncbi:MAG: NADP-dependent oxidoreductase [Actinocatenispora sp.]